MGILDRYHDPEGVLAFRARFLGALMGVYFIPVGYLLAVLFGIPGGWRVAFMLAFSVVVGLIASRFIATISTSAGNAVGRFLQPSGDTSPYRTTYSYEQSLEARGDVAGAIRAYEQAMLDNPFDPEPRLQAAELHARAGQALRAADLFGEARRLTTGQHSRELYATQRLVDLYLGPLAQPGRALVELRRLTDRFPRTQEAAAAAETLARLKREDRERSASDRTNE